MLKKILFISSALFFSVCAYSQQTVPVEMLGKKKGGIKVLKQNNTDYAEAGKLAKLLKFQTTWFGQSGQLNLRGPNSYIAVVRRDQKTATVNGKEENMGGAALMQEGDLYAPLSFFANGSPGKTAGYKASLEGGKLLIEKFYNIEFLEPEITVDGAKIIFPKKGALKADIKSKNSGKAEIFIPKAVVKRTGNIKVKNNFFDRVDVSENKDGVRLIFLLKKNAAHWDFYEASPDAFVFEASANKINRSAVNLPSAAPVAEQEASSQAETLRPSVLDGAEPLGDDFFGPQTVAAAPQKPLPSAVLKTLPASVARMDKPGKKNRKARILIDPGHGGKDPGAMRRGSAREKEINLAVAKELYELLSKDKDFEVKMTRNNDVFIALGTRAKMANEFKADIFISIHSNAAKRVSAHGFEVYFRSDKASSAEAAETAALENEALQYEGKSAASVSFADLLLKSLATNENMNESSKIASHIRNAVSKNSKAIGISVFQNNCIKQANFYVLRGVEAPSVLIEMGYMSNVNDRKRLNNKSARGKIAESLRDGIVSYARAEGWK